MTTPRCASAPETSTLRMRACAYGLRTTLSQTIPGSEMSSTNVAWPVSSFVSSLRASGRPTMRPTSTSVAMAMPSSYVSAAA